MGYMSRRGKRPNEYASKSSHGNIIKDETIEEFLNDCMLPKSAEEVDLSSHTSLLLDRNINNPISNIFAIDGGYTEVPVRSEFPSSTISFFQFGASGFSIEDLNNLSNQPFIDPTDMAKLKNIERFKLALPTKNITLKSERNLVNSVRRTIFDFFSKQPKSKNASLDEEKFIDTVRWFIFEEYKRVPKQNWNLANCPNCSESNILLVRSKMSKNHTFNCPECNELIFLTDVFRLHEAIDNELGAGGILGYLTNLLEHMLLVHLIKTISVIRKSLLAEMLFIKDGPLAYFGQTANLHKPMRSLTNYLLSEHNLFLAGLEKSGPFVEHADEISGRLKPGTILLLDNDYIYKYILPGTPDSNNPYARSSYYGGKVIFKSYDERMYVVTVPIANAEVILSPTKDDYKNIDIILNNIEKLKCDMYDSALIPVTLVNKLVSLSNHPSSIILEKFVKNKIGK